MKKGYRIAFKWLSIGGLIDFITYNDLDKAIKEMKEINNDPSYEFIKMEVVKDTGEKDKMKWFKVYSGYECGGPEDGMMVHSYTSMIEAKTAEEAEKITKEYNKDDPDFIGCRAIEASQEEINKHLKELVYYSELPF